MIRTILLGPQVAVEPTGVISPFGTFLGTTFKVPAGGTLTFVSVMAPVDTPPTFVRVTLYPSHLLDDENFEGEKYPHQLIPAAYPWGPRDFPIAVTWEGRHRVDDNFEHTLEITIHDGSGASSPIWNAMALVEVEE